MSFSENPYRAMTIIGINAQDGDVLIPYKWECLGCGGESKEEFTPDTSIMEIRVSYTEHLMKSHKRTAEDFKNWNWE